MRDNATAISQSEAATLFADLTSAKTLVLAVSGGPDSTALMMLAAHWRKAIRRGPDLIAVTVDHGLRAEGKREARDVAKLAKTLGIAHRTLKWAGAKPRTGLPQAARNARYRLLADAARKAGASHILTAHTRDDQAETVVMRLSRGSGIAGLAAMQRVSVLSYPSPERGGSIVRSAIGEGSRRTMTPTRIASRSDLPLAGGGEEESAVSRRPGMTEVLLLRPFLDIPKARLVATLQQTGTAFADDPTNRDAAFTRARLRGLMPLLAAEGLDAARLALLARRLRRSDEAIEQMVDIVWHGLTAGGRGPSIVFDAHALARTPGEVRLRLIGRAIDTAGSEGPVELAKLEALVEALEGCLESGTRWRRSLAGALVTVRHGAVTVETAPPRRSAGGRGRPNALTKAAGKRAKPVKSR